MRKRHIKGYIQITCSKCGELLSESRKANKQKYCLKCHAEYMRLHRPKHSKLSPEAKMKANARAYLNTYVKRGRVTKLPCSVCGSQIVEAHHPDYSKPLEVIWLCRKHHLNIKNT